MDLIKLLIDLTKFLIYIRWSGAAKNCKVGVKTGYMCKCATEKSTGTATAESTTPRTMSASADLAKNDLHLIKAFILSKHYSERTHVSHIDDNG